MTNDQIHFSFTLVSDAVAKGFKVEYRLGKGSDVIKGYPTNVTFEHPDADTALAEAKTYAMSVLLAYFGNQEASKPEVCVVCGKSPAQWNPGGSTCEEHTEAY